ncbi:MAG: M24 family metallopeptidase [Candidatus Rokuibacteriota bacterium]|jgi:Xaa-Pro dipeptidase
MDQHVKARLTKVLDAEGLDAIVASTPENLQYVTGFRSIAHALFRGLELYGVFTRQGVGLVIPFIDSTGVSADGIEVDRLACYGKFFFNYADPPGAVGARVREITSAPAAGPGEALREVLGGFGALGKRIALDEAGVFPATWQRLTEQLAGTTIGPAYAHFRTARMVKSSREIACLEKAALIAEDGIAAVLGMLKPGVTEREAASVFEQEVVRKGAQTFFTVVTMGHRAALADVYASDAALKAGDLIRLDLGCVYQGYRSDISRTAVMGAPSDKQLRYYNAARDGEKAAIAAMKPGVPVNQIFETAMRVARANGMPHYERNHVGHGIGLEPYDPPTINAAAGLALEPGMVFCVETPYYEHGWGGIQVEDAVEITTAGVRRLTQSSQELQIVG